MGPTLITLPAGSGTGYSYDLKNRLNSVADSKGNTVNVYEYGLTNEQ